MGRDWAFTDFVRASAASGKPAEGEVLEHFLEQLRGALVHELKKKDMWMSPPRFLGIFGYPSWAHEDAINELSQDCALFILCRLPTLAKHAEIKPNVEGLVFRIIRNFLNDRQKQHDLLGFRVYKALRELVKGAMDRGLVRLHPDCPSLEDRAWLMFDNQTNSLSGQEEERILDAWVQATIPEFLPTMIQFGAQKQAVILPRLADRLATLRSTGISGFCFRTLVQSWQSRARKHWASMLAETNGNVGFEARELVFVAPGKPAGSNGFEQRQAYAALRRCVEQQIEGVDESLLTRERLFAIWRALLIVADEEQKIPSDRALSRLLEIPRRQIGRLRTLLQPMVRQCQEGRPGEDRRGENR